MAETRSTFYDRQEVRSHADREAAVFHALPGLLRHALDNAPALAGHLQGLNPDAIGSREELAGLPVLHASDIEGFQRAEPPFGGLVATPIGRLSRILRDPDGRFVPEGIRVDYWRFARALYAAGFQRAQVILHGYASGLEPNAAMAEGGARALGCPIVPAGTLVAQALAAIATQTKATQWIGPVAPLASALESVPASRPRPVIVRALTLEAKPDPNACSTLVRHGIELFRVWATPEIGLVAYESSAHEGLVVDESLIVEVVRPGTGVPVPVGEVGELLVTAFNPDYPLIRFATGALAALMPGESPCGRTNLRLRGPLGHADGESRIDGLRLQPGQVQDIARRHREIGRVRLVLGDGTGSGRIVLRCEADGRPDGLGEAIAETVRAFTGLSAEIELVPPGSLPNDGRVIDDLRGRG